MGSVPGEWADDALCREVGLAVFASPLPSERAAAMRVCHSCPVLADCREWASGHEWLGVTVAGWQAPDAPGLPASPVYPRGVSAAR
jgi:hypothetical protein